MTTRRGGCVGGDVIDASSSSSSWDVSRPALAAQLPGDGGGRDARAAALLRRRYVSWGGDGAGAVAPSLLSDVRPVMGVMGVMGGAVAPSLLSDVRPVLAADAEAGGGSEEEWQRVTYRTKDHRLPYDAPPLAKVPR